jgi:multidrug efflux pump subunit AcrA (membrane-fusion protein)
MRYLLTAVAIGLASLTMLGTTSAESVTKPDCLVSLVDEAQVPAQEEGVLKEVLAQDGQQVEANQVIARIDDTLSVLQKDVAVAEFKVANRRAQDRVSVEYAQAAANVAKRDYWRKKEANDKVPGSVTQADIDLANLQFVQYDLQTRKSEFELEIAALEAKVKEASLKAADEHIVRREIKAPWAGAVDRVIRHAGDWVKPGDPLLRLLRMDKLRVKCSLNAADRAPSEVVGRPVAITVKLARGRSAAFQGKVTGVSPLVEGNDTFLVWAEVDNRKENGFWLLRDGMRADMTIELK